MEMTDRPISAAINRRHWIRTLASGAGGLAIGSLAWPDMGCADEVRKPTRFQLACMTLPYARFPLERALRGIREAGYEYVAWGTTHQEDSDGKQTPVMAVDATPDTARQLATRCRDMGLEPVMMFSMVYPENKEAIKILTQRIHQAAAAGIGQVLTFGHTEGGNLEVWVKRLKQLAPIARDQGVTIVVKQHGGATGTGEACAKIVREVNDPNIMVNFDAGNVMDYMNVDPIPDLQKCKEFVRSFCIKDHREWPKDQDCGPGFGQVDHYRLLEPVAFTGLEMPLCCENVFAPALEGRDKPEQIDALARRAREYMEWVIAGLQGKEK